MEAKIFCIKEDVKVLYKIKSQMLGDIFGELFFSRLFIFIFLPCAPPPDMCTGPSVNEA